MPIIGTEPMPVVLVEGDARARGQEHGSLTRARVKQNVEKYTERFAHFAGLSRDEARARATEYTDAIRDYDPAMLEEIEGIAEGAECDLRDVLAINCRSELMFSAGSAAECTSFGLQPEATANGHTYVGQNWDWAPDVRETLILLVIKQPPRPTVVLLDEAGLIGRMGINSAGIALSTNTLIAEGARIGVPYNALLRGILNSASMAEAIGALVRPQRALGANFLLGDGGGQVLDIEATAENVDYLAPREGLITHGNHFAGARHRGRDMSLERFPDSLYRECRLRDALLAASPPLSEEEMREALCDRYGHPNAICRSVDPAIDPTDQIETVASIVMDATERRFLLAAGRPDENPYFEFTVDRLAEGNVAMAA